MTPHEVGRILKAGRAQTHVPYLQNALTAMIYECEAIAAEASPSMDIDAEVREPVRQIDRPGGATVFASQPAVVAQGGDRYIKSVDQFFADNPDLVYRESVTPDLDAEVAANPERYDNPVTRDAAKAASYVSTGTDHSQTAYPAAEVQHSDDGQYHRVAVYFGEDAKQAEHFAEWIEERAWLLPQPIPNPPLTAPQPVMGVQYAEAKGQMESDLMRHDEPEPIVQPVADKVIPGLNDHPVGNGQELEPDWNAGFITSPDLKADDVVTAEIFDYRSPEAREQMPVTPMPAGPNVGLGRALSHLDEPPSHYDRGPAVDTQPLQRLIQDPAQTYHEFEPAGDGTVEKHFCRWCDSSRYAEQHVLAKDPARKA